MEFFEQIAGKYRFTREIHHDEGMVNLVDGVAILEKSGKNLRYDEHGILRIGAQSFQAERRYYWKANGAEILVEFEDGRAFHRFFLNNPQAEHFCAPDLYQVRYEFDWPQWQAHWRVDGPRKSYRMSSFYIPLE